MDENVQALIDAANVLLAITMQQYTDHGVGGRFVSDEEVALCLAIHNIEMARRPLRVNQSEQLRLFARFAG